MIDRDKVRRLASGELAVHGHHDPNSAAANTPWQ